MMQQLDKFNKYYTNMFVSKFRAALIATNIFGKQFFSLLFYAVCSVREFQLKYPVYWKRQLSLLHK